MSRHQDLMAVAELALKKLFEDLSVRPEKSIESLKKLRETIDGMIDAIKADIEG